MKMITRRWTLSLLLPAVVIIFTTHIALEVVFGFLIAPSSNTVTINRSKQLLDRSLRQQLQEIPQVALYAENNDDPNEEEEGDNVHPSGNPYADPNYPDLEFVNYDDPEYHVDQGIVDGAFQGLRNEANDLAGKSTEEQIEEMREERRRQNDEYQFQTYFASVLQKGKDIYGEWTVYKTSTFLSDDSKDSNDRSPRLVKAGSGSSSGEPTLRVKTRGYKEIVETDSPYPIDAERIRHVEKIIPFSAQDGSNAQSSGSPKAIHTEEETITTTYWPDLLASRDFRGHQGIMVCGNSWTICTAVNLNDIDSKNKNINNNNDEASYKGPFGQYRAEIGIQEKNMRLRLKFDYSVLDEEKEQKQISNNSPPPPLHLKSLTVCREVVGSWPLERSIEDALMREAFYSVSGADGGLYDPPPIRSDEQAGQYMLLDLEGRASVLFPFLLDQDPKAHNGEGWVHSLDWQPGNMRYQVDRKVNSGENLLGLRTLELSEVQGADAATYRPRDGGQNMRQ